MENFKAYNPTCLFFGVNVLNSLNKRILEFGSNVLLVYGKGSIKENGVYNNILKNIDSNKVKLTEFSGIKPNPRYEDVDAAARFAKKNNIDVIVAVGGGSVIDSAKMIALTACVNHSSWDFMIEKQTPLKSLPVICVLTNAATGSEMNPFAVIQNDKTIQKIGYGHPLLFPKYSFLDPTFTISVSENYTAYGITDIIAHCLEAFFGKGESDLTDRIAASIIKETIEKGEKLLKDLKNYNLRADIMLASTMALNGITFYGKSSGDWGVHSIGHELSSLYDIPHGASLSIAYPAWLKLHKTRAEAKIKKLGELVFNVSTVEDTINCFENFFVSIKAPIRLFEVIDNVDSEQIINQMLRNKVGGYYYSINFEDCKSLLRFMTKKDYF